MNIYLVEGVTLTFTEFIQLLTETSPDIYNDYQRWKLAWGKDLRSEILNCDSDESDPDEVQIFTEYMLWSDDLWKTGMCPDPSHLLSNNQKKEADARLNGNQWLTWACCSPNACKEFAIGRITGPFDPFTDKIEIYAPSILANYHSLL